MYELYRLTEEEIEIVAGAAGLDIRAEAAFVRAEILAGREFDRVYVNGGDSHIPGALPIEAVFMDAMRRAPRAPVAALAEGN